MNGTATMDRDWDEIAEWLEEHQLPAQHPLANRSIDVLNMYRWRQGGTDGFGEFFNQLDGALVSFWRPEPDEPDSLTEQLITALNGESTSRTVQKHLSASSGPDAGSLYTDFVAELERDLGEEHVAQFMRYDTIESHGLHHLDVPTGINVFELWLYGGGEPRCAVYGVDLGSDDSGQWQQADPAASDVYESFGAEPEQSPLQLGHYRDAGVFTDPLSSLEHYVGSLDRFGDVDVDSDPADYEDEIANLEACYYDGVDVAETTYSREALYHFAAQQDQRLGGRGGRRGISNLSRFLTAAMETHPADRFVLPDMPKTAVRADDTDILVLGDAGPCTGFGTENAEIYVTGEVSPGYSNTCNIGWEMENTEVFAAVRPPYNLRPYYATGKMGFLFTRGDNDGGYSFVVRDGEYDDSSWHTEFPDPSL